MSDGAQPVHHPPPPLLGPDEPPPFEIVNKEGAARFLLVCDHASAVIPGRLDGLGLDETTRCGHIAWDLGAAEVTRTLSARFDAKALLANYSRLVIDVNRGLDDPTSIPVISDRIVIPGNRNLVEGEVDERVEALFRPYHRAIAEALDEFRRRAVSPALVSVHSFVPAIAGEDRPWQVGVLWDRDPRMAVPFIDKLRREWNVCVGDNLPYSGRDHYTYTVDYHGARVGLPHLAMEIRADLLKSPEGAAHWSHIIGAVLEEILAEPDLFRVEHFP